MKKQPFCFVDPAAAGVVCECSQHVKAKQVFACTAYSKLGQVAEGPLRGGFSLAAPNIWYEV